MAAYATHHVALRVADVERAARFYAEAFGGRLLTRPYLREGPEAESTWGGLGGARYRICHVALDAGAVELFELLSPGDLPAQRPLDPAAGQLHFAIRVDDVEAALAAVERAGGRRLWPERRIIGVGVSVIYVADPDGNAIELTESTMERIAALVRAAHPDSRPADPPPPRGAVTGFWHAGVTVRDMERSLRFYRDALGLELELLADTAGDYRWRVWGLTAERAIVAFLRVPGSDARIELFEFAGVERHPASARPCDYGAGHFCLYVDDAEAVHARLAAAGFRSRSDGVVTAESGPRAGARIVYCIDPDGYHVELYQPPPQAG